MRRPTRPTRCGATSKRRSPPDAKDRHVPARRAVRRRSDPEPQRGLPEGSAPGQDQPQHRHLLRRRRPHPGARLGAARRAAGLRRVGAEAVPADRRRRELPQRGADPAVRHRARGNALRPRRDDPGGRLERRPEGRRRLPRSAGSRAARSGSATRPGTTTGRCSKAPASPSTPTRTTTLLPAASRSTRCSRRCAACRRRAWCCCTPAATTRPAST